MKTIRPSELFQQPNNGTLLSEARMLVDHGRETAEGVQCPCCGQEAKIYRRNLDSMMAEALTIFYRHAKKVGFNAWIDLPREFPGRLMSGGDIAKLRRWGITEAPQIDPQNWKRVQGGFWRLTPLGVRFASNRLRVPQSEICYANETIGFEGPMVKIEDCFDSPFNYAELMNGVALTRV